MLDVGMRCPTLATALWSWAELSCHGFAINGASPVKAQLNPPLTSIRNARHMSDACVTLIVDLG